jgi:3-oxoacyl-[acyl-carrier-protein] synthase-3
LKRDVYIAATGTYFPNAPIGNDQIEAILGQVGGRPSRAKNLILKSNQILTRYYAIDPVTRQSTHSNAQLTALAIQDLFENSQSLSLDQLDILISGTSSPDLLFPAHGSMVQGHLPGFTGEVITTAGVCCSSAAALKIGYLNVRAGEAEHVLVTGSETASKFMRSEFFAPEQESRLEDLALDPSVAFEHDFLRWMLSDGAGAVHLSGRPQEGRVNLKINWIEGRSYASEQPVCMFGGGELRGQEIIAWKDLEALSEASPFAMNIHQDIRLLRTFAAKLTIERGLAEIKKKRGLSPGDYDWFLPHYSSHFFRQIAFEALQRIDFEIPYERWFTTLYEHGNTGSASILVFIHELLRRQTLRPGSRILCYVPESARFSVYFFELEVV